jgi:6-phosphofructokinase
VVSEGIRDAEGQFIGQHKIRGNEGDAFGHVIHSLTTGVAAYLSDLVWEKLGIQSRFLRPSLIGRALSSCASQTDRGEALLVGRQAVTHLANGQTGRMVTLERHSNMPYRCETGLAELSIVANAEHLLPRDFINKEGNMPTSRFIEYAMPLIDGPLPQLARLKGIRVPQKTS